MNEYKKKAFFGLVKLDTYREVFSMLGENTEELEGSRKIACSLYKEGKYREAGDIAKGVRQYVSDILKYMKQEKSHSEKIKDMQKRLLS